jgi:hypothetical protein
MDPYEWKLVKVKNGKTKAIIVSEKEDLQDWNGGATDHDWERRLQQRGIVIEPSIMSKKEIKKKKLEIDKDFPKEVWKYYKFTK